MIKENRAIMLNYEVDEVDSGRKGKYTPNERGIQNTFLSTSQTTILNVIVS